MASMPQPDDWRCALCLDTLFKPAVNSPCGHVFCYWCMHRAMSPYAPSACPVCRAKYAHLPAICSKLHHFLACQFPEAYTQRREETEAEERESSYASTEPPSDDVLPQAPDAWQPRHFACDDPRCGRLLCRPLVLNCGHAVCQACLGAGSADGGSGSCGTAAAAPNSSSTGRASAIGGGGVAYECPACGMAARQPSAVCKQLEDLLRQLFPDEARQRAAQSEAELAQRAAAAPAAEGEARPSTPRAAAAGAAGSAALAGTPRRGGAAAEAEVGAVVDPHSTLSPSLASALRRRAAGGGDNGELAERLEANLRRLSAGEGYSWHGVGCDGCGQYPILGRRFQCQDCPDAMGFDLCGACYDRGLSDLVGRFNQRHTPVHSMRLMRPRVTAMHLLQAANPELPMEQLMWLLELTLHGGDDDEEATAPSGQQQAQQQAWQQHHQHHQQQQVAVEAAENSGAAPAPEPGASSGGNVMPVLRRGPRPAFMPGAEHPSPSAYPLQQPEQRQQPACPSEQQPQQQQQQQQQQQEPASSSSRHRREALTPKRAMAPRIRHRAQAASVKAAPLQLSALPDALLAQVLSHISLKERLRLCLVCRRWRDLAVSPELLQEIDVHVWPGGGVAMSKFRSLLRWLLQHAAHARKVIFSQQPADPDNPFSDEDGTEFSVLLDGCLAACAGSSQLRVLEVTLHSSYVLCGWALLLRGLQRLKLWVAGEAGVYLPLDGLAACRWLELAGIGGQGLVFGPAAAFPPALENLALIGHRGPAVPEQVSRLTRLESLRLQRAEYDAHGFGPLVPLGSSLQHLRIIGTAWPSCLSSLTALRALELTILDGGDGGSATGLHEALQRLSGLTGLWLQGFTTIPAAAFCLPQLAWLCVQPHATAEHNVAVSLLCGSVSRSLRRLVTTAALAQRSLPFLAAAERLELLHFLDSPRPPQPLQPDAFALQQSWDALWRWAERCATLRRFELSRPRPGAPPAPFFSDSQDWKLLDKCAHLAGRRPDMTVRSVDAWAYSDQPRRSLVPPKWW